ncbi:SURF1 family protein [Brevundimonas vesicularis]|uniref:SURF1 family protein n=1 Tax=Brevundimonas vesicularis TaxID=41276 RepID=UPI0038D4EFCC
MIARAPKPFPWLLSLGALILLAILVSLGVWQSQRLVWKEGLIRAADSAAEAEVLPLAKALLLDNPEFRQVLLTCPGLAKAPFVELQSILDGQSGTRLVSACHEISGRVILVDRGFIPAEVSERPAVDLDDTMPSVVHGVLRQVPAPSPLTPPPANGRFYARDTEAMALALKVEGRVESLSVYALSAVSPDFPTLVPGAPPVAFSNNHLGYALTWFGLAIALIVFYGVLLRRRLNAKDL